MKLELAEKWVSDAVWDDLPAEVALRTLRNRLETVALLLPPAARKANEDVEHIHQLRVWTRRAAAALKLYKKLLPAKSTVRMKKQLKHIRRAANSARDCDILIEMLSLRSPTMSVRRNLKQLQSERKTAQKGVVEIDRKLMHHDRFDSRIVGLLKKIESRQQNSSSSDGVCFGVWARQRLARRVREFYAAIPRNKNDRQALHRFRICGKEVRYAMELLCAVFPKRFRTKHYALIEQVQERLGEINDLAMLIDHFDRPLPEHKPSDAAAQKKLKGDAERRYEYAVENFWKWCTPRRLARWRADWKKLLAEPARQTRR